MFGSHAIILMIFLMIEQFQLEMKLMEKYYMLLVVLLVETFILVKWVDTLEVELLLDFLEKNYLFLLLKFLFIKCNAVL